MKRWHFSGQAAAHGSSKAHRKIGSIGQRTIPSKVWAGKKMPGRLGGANRITYNMRIVRTDVPKSLLYLKGAVPGSIGDLVMIEDAQKKREKQYRHLPYPTFLPKKGVVYPDIEDIKPPIRDPSEAVRHENNIRGLKDDDPEDDGVIVDETGTILIGEEYEEEIE
eukprot:TRINITY_DN3159_c0_g2_i1.p1 TRINITY_DN3159_c0_g2~~TRINITY_DN3159_c0_g2_i1.p1  ORF type:complete len:165 (-),score=32.69 TRINITY_DN3159_c0_g2_i1:124-618(-)